MNDRSHIKSPSTLTQELKDAKTGAQALNVLRNCYVAHDQMVGEAINHFGIRLACHAGCDLCCFFRVGAKTHEILLIAETVKSKFQATAQAELRSRLGDNARIVQSMTKNEQCATNIRCPLLIDHQCAVYSIRPLGCRRHHAQDFEACKFSYENPQDMQHPGSRHAKLLLAIEYIDDSIGYIFAQCDFDQTDYELNMGLLEALSTGKSLRRWWDRKKAFIQAEQK